MLSEQMLNNMTLSELVAYSETFSDVPSRVAQALNKTAIECFSEAQDYISYCYSQGYDIDAWELAVNLGFQLVDGPEEE